MRKIFKILPKRTMFAVLDNQPYHKRTIQRIKIIKADEINTIINDIVEKVRFLNS